MAESPEDHFYHYPTLVDYLTLEKEPSMLTKLPQKFIFDQTFSPASAEPPLLPIRSNSNLPITLADNPTYFEEGFAESSFRGKSSVFPPRARDPAPPLPPSRGRLFSLPPIPVTGSGLSNDEITEEPELDVFLNPSETEFDGNLPPVPKSEKRNSPFGRITQFLWRSKGSSSKGSVGGSSIASTGSRSRSASSGISSPPFTPDSSISNYTNSLDSDSHSSSHSQPSTHSDQGHYPEIHFYRPTRVNQEEEDYDLDTLKPLPPLYINERPFSRGRTHSLSLPLSKDTPAPKPFSSNSEQPSYYNTSNLETFHCPNITRRHSVPSEPTSPTSTNVDPNAYANWTGADDGGPMVGGGAGYLVPIQTRPNNPSGGTLKRPPRENIYLNDLPFPKVSDAEDVLNTVQVEVHTPTSSHTYSDMFCNSSASTTIPQSAYSYRRPSLGQGQRQICSSDSSSTIEAASTSNGELRQIYKPQPQSRLRREYGGKETDCEPYCKFCFATSLPPVVSSSRSSRMNVGILSCHGCFFSQRAVGQIRKIFDTIVTPDRKKINVNLQTFDIQEVGQNAKGVELHRAKIQIVVISHSFVDHLRHESSVQKRVSPINQILRSKRAIIVLLSGVLNGGASASNQNEVADGFQQYLLEFANWETLELKPSSKLDGEFYTKFAEKVIRIYNLEQRPPARFSIFPKKVTKVQQKVVIFFKTAIENGDIVNVQIGRGRKKEFVQEIVLVNPYSGIIKLPPTLFTDDRSALIEITVTLNEQSLGSKVLKYDHNSHLWEDDAVLDAGGAGGEEMPIDNSESPTPSSELRSSPSSSSRVPPAEYYDMPRPTKQDYCLPPPARPVVPQKPQSSRKKEVVVVVTSSSPQDTHPTTAPFQQYENFVKNSGN